MIVEMKKGAKVEEVRGVVERANSLGLKTQLNLGTDKTVIALLGGQTGQHRFDCTIRYVVQYVNLATSQGALSLTRGITN